MRRCCHAQNGHKMAEKRLSSGKISGCGHASVLPRENGAMSAGREPLRRGCHARTGPQRRGCHAKTGPCRLGGSPCVGAATRKRGHVGCAGAPASGLPRENWAMSAEREPQRRGCHAKTGPCRLSGSPGAATRKNLNSEKKF